jgi:2-methylisocitrate lyase-like PEP mutase family enzyme
MIGHITVSGTSASPELNKTHLICAWIVIMMMSSIQSEKAEFFRSLHEARNKILVLPNAWDVASARLFENMGFSAIATSSAGMLVSLGYPDGEDIGRESFLSAIKRISSVLSVPLSVDSVSGFGSTPEEIAITIRGLIESGAVGLNIEDFDHKTKKLFPVEKQLEKLKAIKSVGKSMKTPIVINARTDALRYAKGGDAEKFDEAVRRANSYRDAGVDCVYPMGLTEKAAISKFVKSMDNFPVNVMIRNGLPTIKELQELGVARVSFGPSASYATMGLLKRISREVLEKGTFSLLVDDAISFEELNSLASKRK